MLGYEYDNQEDKQITNHIIRRHKKILYKIANSGVMALLCNEPNDFLLLECCDGYYGYHLDKEDCLELSEMFREIADVIDI